MANLKIDSLHKYYGDFHAVRGVSLDIPEGEFTVLVGPSGCGKSTLLRTIAGLEDVDQGEIAINGVVMNDAPPRDRNIAMVFQNYALYPHMSVYDNIAFGLRARKRPESEIGPAVARAAEMLDIGGMLDRYPRQLSGGQRQRVAIGRAIVRDAHLFLFDEPLSNLDAQLREEMRGEIKRLHQEIGKTMIYVTHDQIEAMTLADRIVLMSSGVIEQQGPPLELFEKPVSRFVAGFLGSPAMNFISATVKRDGDAIVLAFGEGKALPVSGAMRDKLTDHHDAPVIFGVRPEYVCAARNVGRESDRPILRATIDLIQPTGSRSYCTFRLGGVDALVELQVHDVEKPGEDVDLAFDMRRAVIIDPKTERVL